MSKLLPWWVIDLNQAGGLHYDIRWCTLYIGSVDFFVNIVIFCLIHCQFILFPLSKFKYSAMVGC